MYGEFEGLKEWQKEEYAIYHSNGLGGRKNHITACYFCMINLKGINRKNKHHVQHPDVPSAIRQIPHDPDIPVPEPDDNMIYSSDSRHNDMTVVAGDNA